MRAQQALVALGMIGLTSAGFALVPRSDERPAASPSPVESPAPVPSPSPSAGASPQGTSTSTALPPSSCGATGARVVTYRIEVDDGVKESVRDFARAIRSTLCDERSWIASEHARFRLDQRKGKLLIGLRSPAETERRCKKLIGLSVNRKYSCGTLREVVINSARWLGSGPFWKGTLQSYRRMLMNHEVGHALGLHHVSCPRTGAPAPVMMQQSKGMKSPNGKTCTENPWPLKSELARLRRA